MPKSVEIQITDEQLDEISKERIKELRAEVFKLTKEAQKLREELAKTKRGLDFYDRVKEAAKDYLDLTDYDYSYRR